MVELHVKTAPASASGLTLALLETHSSSARGCSKPRLMTWTLNHLAMRLKCRFSLGRSGQGLDSAAAALGLPRGAVAGGQ